MKLLSFFIGTLFLSAPAWAITAPNSYLCTGKQDTIKLTYTTTSISGEATFEYVRLEDDFEGREVSVDRTEQIEKTVTPLGDLITIIDGKRTIPDYRVNSVSIVLPRINLSTEEDTVKFDTVIIETTMRSSFSGPQHIVNIPIQKSRYYPVSCSANVVHF